MKAAAVFSVVLIFATSALSGGIIVVPKPDPKPKPEAFPDIAPSGQVYFDIVDLINYTPGSSSTLKGSGTFKVDGAKVGDLTVTLGRSVAQGPTISGNPTILVTLTENLKGKVYGDNISSYSIANYYVSLDEDVVWLHRIEITDSNGYADQTFDDPAVLYKRRIPANTAQANLLGGWNPPSATFTLGTSTASTSISNGTFTTVSWEDSFDEGIVSFEGKESLMPGVGRIYVEQYVRILDPGYSVVEVFFSAKWDSGDPVPYGQPRLFHPWMAGTPWDKGWSREGNMSFHALEYPYVFLPTGDWWYSAYPVTGFRYLWRPDEGWVATNKDTFPYAYGLKDQAWVKLTE